MTTSRGILAKLGLENPPMPAGLAPDAHWTTEPRFSPVEGTCYELAFTHIPMREQMRPVIKRVRVEGPTIEDWVDLDTERPIERRLYAYAIKAYRRIDVGPAYEHDDASRTRPDRNLH